MPKSIIPQLRLAAHQLPGRSDASPASVVSALGAVQAQDYAHALWAIGCRAPGSTVASVEDAVREKKIVRTWPMRRTLHFIPAADVQWMLKLLTPRMIAAAAGRMHQLELTDAILRRAEKILVKELRGQPPQARSEVMTILERGGVKTDSQRGIHIISRLAMEGLVCGGPRQDKQPTFVLIDEWVPATKRKNLDPEEALATLARRFFGGHGPATIPDFVWWSGLKVSDAKAALAFVAKDLSSIEEDGLTYWYARDLEPVAGNESPAHLLPGFDEYLLGYKDRRHVLEAAHANRVVPGGNGMFMPMMLRRGQIVGIWKRGTVTKDGAKLVLEPFAGRLTKVETREFTEAANRYGTFAGIKTRIALQE